MVDCKKCDNGLESFQMDETPKLNVRGKEIGIAALDDIMKEVHNAGLSEDRIGQELLEQVMQKDYVPPSLEKDYREALVREYRRRYG